MSQGIHQNSFVGDVDHVCVQGFNMEFFSTDCSVDLSCSPACCPTCCQKGDETCYQDQIADFLSGQDEVLESTSTRANYGFDPAILSESNTFQFADLGDAPPAMDDFSSP